MASINFPAWYLGRHPDKHIITASYSAELAQDFGGKTRDLVNSEEYKTIFDTTLREDSQSKAKWETENGGYYIAVGVGGAITGRGADILLIDDPFKNRQEAESPLQRESVWGWYTSTAYTRLEPGGAVVLIMTRWHNDDLAGRLLELEAEEGNEQWEILSLPALAEVDELDRSQGEALWPDRYSKADLERIKATIGLRDWASLYQQNPIISETQEFKEEDFRYFEESELEGKVLNFTITVDLAISQKDSADSSAFVVRAKDPRSPNWYVTDAFKGRLTPLEVIDTIFNLYHQYRPRGSVTVGIETVAYQKSLIYFLNEEMRKRQIFIRIVELKSKEKKEERIRGLIPLFKTGTLFLRRNHTDLKDELMQFPNGIHDDLADALAFQLQMGENTSIRSRRQQPQIERSETTGY